MAADVILGMQGVHWAVLGAAAAAVGGGSGSAVGITYAAEVAGGVLAEDPDKFAGMLALCALPGTQGIYGFITAILVMVFFDLLSGKGADLAAVNGLYVFFACLPVAFSCAVSAVYQGKTSAAAAGMVARRGETGKALIFPALVETYAVLSLITTILFLVSIRAGLS